MKYFILYHYGGVYVDMDMGIVKCGLRNLLKQCETGLVKSKIGFVADFFFTKPKNPFFFQMITNLVSEQSRINYFLPFLTIFFTTGPLYITSQYLKYENKSSICVFEHHLMSNDFFFFHCEGNSWYEYDALIGNVVINNYSTILFSILFLVCIYLVYKKYLSKIVRKFE